jgi:hypothetical protein
MSGIISSNNFAKALFPGVSSWYGRAYDEFPTEWTDLFTSYTSSRAYEEDVGITSFGLANRKDEAQAISYDDESQAFITRYAHAVFALGFIITQEMYEDDLYDVVGKRRAEALAFSMRQTKEILGANVYNRAFDSNYTGGDGVSMINNAHPNFAGGTQANTLSTPADLSEAALEQACIDIQKLTDDRGLRISVAPLSLHIPVDLMFEAERILKSPYQVGGNNNDINALYAMGKFPGGVKVNHYFTSDKAWFLRTNVSNSVKHYERRGMKFAMDNDFDTENAKYKATERYSFGWTDWRGVYGSAGA